MLGAAVLNALKQLKANLKRHQAERVRIWTSFCEETPLQGFAFFRSSQFHYERLLWLILIISAIGGTIYSSKETFNDFLSGELVTKSTLVPVAATSFGNLTICIDTHNWNKLLDNDSNVLDRTNISKIFARHESEILSFFVEFPNVLALPNGSAEVVMSLFKFQPYLIQVFRLSFILATEIVGIQFFGATAQTLAPVIGGNYLMSEYNSTSLQILGDFIVNHRLSNSMIVEVTGFILCKLFDVRANQIPGVKSFYGIELMEHDASICDLTRVSWIEHNYIEKYDRLCIRQLVDEMTEPIFAIEQSNMSMRIHADPYYVTSDNRTKMVVDFSGNPKSESYAMAVDTYTGHANFVDIQIENEIRKYIVDANTCRKYTGQLHCIIDRHHEQVSKACDCRLLFMNSSLRDCYNLKNVSLDGSDRNDWYCTQHHALYLSNSGCELEACEQRNFEFKSTPDTRFEILRREDPIKFHNTPGATRRLREIRMEFSMLRPSYIRLDEALKVDSSTFVANLGGSLSLYIGGSFLALIHLITSVGRLVVSLVLAKEDNRQDNEGNELETVTTQP